MTEAEWLTCAEPQQILRFLRGKATERKLRLLACACVRQIWYLLAEGHGRWAVEVADLHADGLVGDQELMAACENAIKARAQSLSFQHHRTKRGSRASSRGAAANAAIAVAHPAATFDGWDWVSGSLAEAAHALGESP